MRTPAWNRREPGKISTPAVCPCAVTPADRIPLCPALRTPSGSTLSSWQPFRQTLRRQNRTRGFKTGLVWNISHFGFRICFGFQVSDFEFGPQPRRILRSVLHHRPFSDRDGHPRTPSVAAGRLRTANYFPTSRQTTWVMSRTMRRPSARASGPHASPPSSTLASDNGL